MPEKETKKVRKRVNTTSKKEKKPKSKMTSKTSLDKMVKLTHNFDISIL